MPNPLNVATPATAAAVGFASVPPPVPAAAATVRVDDETRLSASSCTSMMGCVRSGRPDTAPVGSVRTTSLVAAPAESANPDEVADGSPDTLNASVRSPIAPLMDRLVNVATPPFAVAVEPDSV